MLLQPLVAAEVYVSGRHPFSRRNGEHGIVVPVTSLCCIWKCSYGR